MAGPKDPLLDDSPDLTRQRQELVRWFNDRAPSFTAGYVAAVRLLHVPSFPARVHVICHLVRDIYQFLPATLGVKRPPRAADVFPPLVAELVGAWYRFPLSEKVSRSAIDTGIAVSSQVHRRLLKIVERSRRMRKQPSIGSRPMQASGPGMPESLDDRRRSTVRRVWADKFDLSAVFH